MSETVRKALRGLYSEKTIDEAYAYADRILFGTGKDDDSVPNEEAFKDIIANAFLGGVKYTKERIIRSFGL